MIFRIQLNNIISFSKTVKYIQNRKVAKLWTRFSVCINYWTSADGQSTGWLKNEVFPIQPSRTSITAIQFHLSVRWKRSVPLSASHFLSSSQRVKWSSWRRNWKNYLITGWIWRPSRRMRFCRLCVPWTTIRPDTEEAFTGFLFFRPLSFYWTIKLPAFDRVRRFSPHVYVILSLS